VRHGHEDYLQAARLIWGPAGEFIVTEFARLNDLHFSGELPPLPMVIGITAYGHAWGLCRYEPVSAGRVPRITIASNLFGLGANIVSDTILHELVHAKLDLEGKNPAHNGTPWCQEITRLTPALIGQEIKAAPVKQRRVDNGKRTRRAPDGFLERKQLARWPHSVRPADFDAGDVLYVDSY
jgi:hypothetical protein